jgi:hypothetical protein
MDHGSRIERAAALIVLLLLPWLSGCGDGEEATAIRQYNEALEAYAAGELRHAYASAEKAARLGGAETAGYADFLRGNVKFAECALAEEQAGTAEAEPFALEVALAYARSARDLWQSAAMSRPDWPAARRNVERALLKIRELTDRKEEAKSRKERRPDPKPAPKPEPLDPGLDPDQPPEALLTELSAEEIRRLFERLARKEQEKVDLRRATRRERMSEVERDW